MAAGIVAVITGAAHVDKSQTAMDVFGLFALTGFGGGVFSWLIARWQSLWFPFALHTFMNLWGEVFRISRSALGGWFALALQLACVTVAIIVTNRLTPSLAANGNSVNREGLHPSYRLRAGSLQPRRPESVAERGASAQP